MSRPSPPSNASQAMERGAQASGWESKARTTVATIAAAAGVFGDGVFLDIEAGQAGGAAQQEEEGDEVTGAKNVLTPVGADGGIDELHAPGIGQDGGGP